MMFLFVRLNTVRRSSRIFYCTLACGLGQKVYVGSSRDFDSPAAHDQGVAGVESSEDHRSVILGGDLSLVVVRPEDGSVQFRSLTQG